MLRRTFQFSSDGGIRDGVQTIVWEPVVLECRRSRRDHRAGPRAQSRGVPASPTTPKPPRLGSVVARLAPRASRRRDVGDLFRHPEPEPVHLHPRQPPARRHLLPRGPGILEHPHVRSRRAEGVVRWAVRAGGSALRRRRTREVRLQRDLHARPRPSRPAAIYFSLDFPTVADYPRYPTGNDERHRLVLTRHRRAAVGLHHEHVHHARIGHAVHDRRTVTRQRPEPAGRPAQRGPARAVRVHLSRCLGVSSVDLQVEKGFRFNGTTQVVSLIFQGFNIFSFDNFSGYQGYIPTLPAVNINLRPAEQPDRSRAAAAVRVALRVLSGE